MNVVAPILLLSLLPLMLLGYAQMWWGGAWRGWKWFWTKRYPSLPMRLARPLFVLCEAAVLLVIIWPDPTAVLPAWLVLLSSHIISVLLINDKLRQS